VLPEGAYTPWVKRLLAFLIDFSPIWILAAASFAVESIQSGAGCATDSFVDGTHCSSGVSALPATAAQKALIPISVFFFWNLCYRQGKTGQSIGKSVLKFKVVSEQTWEPIGFWRSFVRQLAHYVDQLICYLGYLWPLWDDKRQTLADKIVGTICIPVGSEATEPTVPPGYPLTYDASPSGGPYSPARTNVPAILSLVFGVFGFVGAPVSAICGIVGLKRAKQGQGGRGLSIAGLTVSGAWVLTVAGILAYLYFTGAFTAYSRPRTGDCIAQIPRDDQALIVAKIDCKAPHEGEVVAVLTLPDGDLPQKAVLDEYKRKCASELAAYAPATIDDPSVGLYVRYPPEQLWRQNGYRDVTCAATFELPRTGSIKG
jgi:uncharacterized RDD family membrane protein YckC